MLAKDPAERLSVVDILAHPWTQTNYSKKHPHSQKGTISSNTSSASRLSSLSELQRAQPNSTKSVLMFKETSMLYYLDQLFGEEIQKELEEKGSYDFEDRNNGKLGEKKEEGRSKGSLGRRRSSFFQKIFPKKG
jgi:serine/threonine protein kinase